MNWRALNWKQGLLRVYYVLWVGLVLAMGAAVIHDKEFNLFGFSIIGGAVVAPFVALKLIAWVAQGFADGSRS